MTIERSYNRDNINERPKNINDQLLSVVSVRPILFVFLDAVKHLYKRLCPSVRYPFLARSPPAQQPRRVGNPNLIRSRISYLGATFICIRGCVHPFVGWSVSPCHVCNCRAVDKINWYCTRHQRGQIQDQPTPLVGAPRLILSYHSNLTFIQTFIQT